MSIGSSQALLGRNYIDIAGRDAEIRRQNFMQTQNTLSEMDRAINLKYQTDYMRYQNAEQRRRANIGAGMQNIMGGLDMAGSMLAMGALSGGNNTNTFGRTDLTPATSGLSPQRNTLSGMSALMGNSTMPAMPGSQLRSPSNIPQPNYGLTSDQMLSRSIFQSLITR
jgi:hypothetical protein